MEPNNYFKGIAGSGLAVLEALLPPVVTVVCLLAAVAVLGRHFDSAYVILAILASLLAYIFISKQNHALRNATNDILSLAWRVLISWAGVVAILLFIGFLTKSSAEFSRLVLSAWLVITPLSIVAALHLSRVLMLRYCLNNGHSRNAVILGFNATSKRLAESIEGSKGLGMNLRGFFDDRNPKRLGCDERKIVGKLDDVQSFVARHKVDVVFIALPIHAVRIIRQLQDTTVSLFFVPDIFFLDLIQSRQHNIRSVPVISLFDSPFNGRNFFTKRVIDLVGALMLLLLLSPLLATIALAIKTTSPGPVLFKQRRYGLDGREFLVWKFRSMTVMEDGGHLVQAHKDDPRVTRVGRYLRQYSLDELPQLFNVVRGDMSLVGPRPHAVAHNEEYRKRINGYMMRHMALPGMTGLAQVNGFRGETRQLEAMEGRVQYDLEYLRNWSPMLDLKILARTCVVVLRGDNAY